VACVLQDWVMELPLREQGTLLTCVRGCDLVPKYPLDSVPRQLVGWLRWTFLNPADLREVGIPGAFFQSTCPEVKGSELGHLPLHWYTHVMHSAEVIAYRHPLASVRWEGLRLYMELAHTLHLPVETIDQMTARLSEDRIEAGTVVR
jgi:hypothetical protein